MPESIASPIVDSATPPHTDKPMRDLTRTRAISGVRTTYIPVMNPVLDTVVRSSPAVCSVYPAASSRPGNGQGQRRDPEAHRQEGEQRIERDGVLDLDERHAPNSGDEDQGEESRHRAILRQTLGLS